LYGVDVVVEAFIVARRQEPRLFLKIAGDGALRADLEARIQNAGIRDDVEFLGQIQYAYLPELYRSADLYISASHSDGSSVSLLEAMASGLPVVVSDIPGNREWVTPGINGNWFIDGDASDLAERILELSQQTQTMEAMGVQGRRIVEARADWSRNRVGIDQAYQIATKEQGSV
jgi:glycosyltransferase involved in cell wall biosynthesis